MINSHMGELSVVHMYLLLTKHIEYCMCVTVTAENGQENYENKDHALKCDIF
jgi:hypothetical protein